MYMILGEITALSTQIAEVALPEYMCRLSMLIVLHQDIYLNLAYRSIYLGKVQ